jgi:protocatechuate 3,4-dioxygenase beta subunit
MSATRRGLALAALVAVVGATMLLLRRRDTSGEMPPTTTPVAEGTTAVPVARTRVAASEPEPAPAPAGAIRVAVTSLDGKPVAGARVELVRGPTEDWTWPFTVPSVAALPTEHTSATGDDGAAVLGSVAEGRWFVIATAPGFGRHVLAGVERRDGDTAADAAVALDRGHTFVGTVHDPDGAPAAGIAVVLQAIPPTVAWASDVACLRTRTGGDGAYRLDNVEPGAYRVWTEVWRGFLVE